MIKFTKINDKVHENNSELKWKNLKMINKYVCAREAVLDKNTDLSIYKVVFFF